MEIFNLNIIKSLTIIVVVLLYWKFVYYRYHKRDFTPISYVIIALPLFLFGIYSFIIKKASFSDINYLYYICLIFLIPAIILELYAIHKHGLNKDVDIFFTWITKKCPYIHYSIWMILAFPGFFFILIGSYVLLGEEHIILWLMIFGAWIHSNIRLYRKAVIK